MVLLLTGPRTPTPSSNQVLLAQRRDFAMAGGFQTLMRWRRVESGEKVKVDDKRKQTGRISFSHVLFLLLFMQFASNRSRFDRLGSAPATFRFPLSVGRTRPRHP